MISMMSLPRATQFTIGALVLALGGWGGLIYSTSAHNDAAEQWARQRSDLQSQVADLSKSGGQLQARVTDLEGSLDQERAKAGDLNSLTSQIDAATGKLNARMATLGERERQIADAGGTLAGLKNQLGEVQARIEHATSSLNQRMALLGERERDLAARLGEKDRL
jgi:peptidoglycan hydrolase CwlO-like protein